jgi:glucose-6-phosphate dehydrogenase assembly protein OpcA
VEEAVTAASGPQLVQTTRHATLLKDLPEALRSLWKAACGAPEGSDVARALTINFVGVAPASDAPALQEATHRLVRRSPCRAFLLLLDDSVREVTAEVGATTRCSGKLRDIVLEEIVLRLPTSWFEHVPGLLRPLLMNDLPNHLYWSGAWPRQPGRIQELMKLCEHCVVDSRHFELPAVELDELANLRQLGHSITDLSWLRVRPWRRALAQAFERVTWTPGMTVTGTLRHGPNATAAAIQLAQWLEARLGGRIELEEASQSTSANPELVEIRLPTHELQVMAEGSQLVVHVTSNSFCLLPFTVPASRGCDGDLLAAAIDIA